MHIIFANGVVASKFSPLKSVNYFWANMKDAMFSFFGVLLGCRPVSWEAGSGLAMLTHEIFYYSRAGKTRLTGCGMNPRAAKAGLGMNSGA
jgi:hypothetical protein